MHDRFGNSTGTDARDARTVRLAGDNRGCGTDADVIVRERNETKEKTKRPNMYRVLLLNDDYTPMEFVVEVLQKFFHMDMDAAVQVMLGVHQNGVGICGVFTYEVAETKVTQVMDYSTKHQHPLRCVTEKA